MSLHKHTSDCDLIVHSLPVLPNNTENEIFLYKSGAVRNINWIFITGTLAWSCLGEYVTLQKLFWILFSNNNKK